ncbi:hypothetical protein LINPERPRIM_LOCUS242 [Linum perenne]
MEYSWAKSGHIQVPNLSKDFFLVQFSAVEDYHRVAFSGPWKIYDYYITVAPWTPEFNEEEPIQKIITWVLLSKLPIHFFNNTTVNRIGNQIDRTIQMDLATSEGARTRWVCVEVDLSKTLLGKYMIRVRVLIRAKNPPTKIPIFLLGSYPAYSLGGKYSGGLRCRFLEGQWSINHKVTVAQVSYQARAERSWEEGSTIQSKRTRRQIRGECNG